MSIKKKRVIAVLLTYLGVMIVVLSIGFGMMIGDDSLDLSSDDVAALFLITNGVAIIAASFASTFPFSE